jgi:WD40 repeat protein
VRWGAAALLLAAAAAAGAAQPPPDTPMLRLDTPMHSARVRKLVHDAPRDRLLTASDDKTVRLWQLPKGRLLRVFRVPIADGFEGRVYAADMHPDGRLVAAGGWTGWDFDGAGAVYLFDADTGELTRRIGGFAETIGTLAFSPDGRHLAVGLQGAQGLRILRTSDFAEVARDTEYGDRILDLGFARDGRLAVASLDGLIRLYDASLRLVGRRKSSTGRQPLSIKFSPDGTLIAVGFSDLAPPAVYRAADLTLAYSADRSALRGQRRLQNIQWSDDGEVLYATGEQEGVGWGRIHRWRERGHGPTETIEVDAQRPGSLWPLKGGRMAFSSEDPLLAVLDPSGKVQVIVDSDLPDLRAHAGALRLSPDAGVVEFHVRNAADARVRLNLRERTALSAAQSLPGLAAPRPGEPGFRLVDDERPRLNGKPIALDDYEILRSSAAAPNGRLFAIGTEWSVRAFDTEAQPLWRYRASGVVWQVAVSADNRTLVAAVGDGTLRWLRAEDGVEYLAAYVHPVTREWIAWTPGGYYVSSTQGDQHIGWHLNRSADEAPLFYRAAQFERLLYRPDIVDAALAARAPRPVVAAPRRERAFDIAELRRIAPPVVRLHASASGAAARIRVEAQAVSLPMQDLTVYVNNVPITASRARALGGAEARRVSREVEVDLAEPENIVRVEISNGQALGVHEIVVDAHGAPRLPPPASGDLYVLAVGVNRFPLLRPNNESADLDFAARDANEVARFFAANGPRHFRNVHVRVLSDDTPEQPSRERIVKALDFLADAGARDTVLLFLASHGISDPRGNYYFVPADATTGDWMGASGGLDEVPSLIHGSVFFDALRRAAGRRVLVVDTCHARGIESRLDVHSLVKRSASSILSLVVAAKANEKSQEYAPGRHGLFTYAWLEALRGDADRNGDGLVTLVEAFDRALPIVDKHRHPQLPQTPQLHAPWPLDRTVLVRRGP